MKLLLFSIVIAVQLPLLAQVTDTLHKAQADTAAYSGTSTALKSNSLMKDTITVNDSILVQKRSNDSLPLDKKYGTLLDDDPLYNPRYAWWKPAGRVLLADVTNWTMDRYLFNYEWARISPSTWKYNIQKGWEWDNDRFGINFIGHPYSGSYYFNIARSNGYNFWQSFPFAVEGSLLWEYFGENTRPSINDIINTPVSGAFLGEVMYRVSSNILDDRARGGKSFQRTAGRDCKSFKSL